MNQRMEFSTLKEEIQSGKFHSILVDSFIWSFQSDTQQTIDSPLTAYNGKIPYQLGFSPTTVPKLSTGYETSPRIWRDNTHSEKRVPKQYP